MADFLNRHAFMAVELESAKGTAETLLAADGGFVLESVSAPHEIEITQQESFASHGSQFGAIPGKRIGVISFSTLLRGTAAVDTPPSISDLLQIAGFKETVNVATSVVYTPEVPASLKTGTVGLYYPPMGAGNGLRHQLKGSVVRSLSVTFTNGQPPVISGEIVGVFDGNGVTDQSPLSPTFDTILPQAFIGATFTVGGTVLKIGSVTIDFGLSAIPVQNPANASGVDYFIQGSPRRATVSFDVKMELEATEAFYGGILGQTEAALSLVHGSGTGKIWTFAGPKLQYTASPTGERDGLATYNVQANLNINSAGDDEWTWTKT